MADAISSLTRSTTVVNTEATGLEGRGHARLQAQGGVESIRGFASLAALRSTESSEALRRAATEVISLVAAPDASSAAGQARIKQSMTKYLDGLEYEFGVQYAPAEFKGRVHGWSLEQAFGDARNAVQNAATIDIKTFQRVLMELIQSTKDYHVNITFYTDEKAKLPFTVQGVGEGVARKYFIEDINRTRLNRDVFPFEKGTEIVALDGKPVGDIVAELKQQGGDNVAGTDQKLAELTLTSRAAARGFDVPQGPVTVTVRDAQGKEHSRQLMWDYTPETTATPQLFGGSSVVSAGRAYQLQMRRSDDKVHEDETIGAKLAASTINNMKLPIADLVGGDEHADPYRLGTREGFLPRLGEVVAEGPKDSPFDWYVYENAEGKLVGYLRISSYSVDDPDASLAAFAEAIKEMQKSTDALVIDQTNNPGGSVFYLYALASMLTDKPLATPRHRMSITQAEVDDAKRTITVGEAVMANKNPDTLAKMLFGPTLGGYPTSATTVQFMLESARFTLDQWRQGKTITDPSHIWAVDHINPNPDQAARYTKPLVFLTNETCFSGGDFMPSILQDNQRAVIMGQRTAGAGGYVREIESANLFGVKSIHVTGSVAERPIGRELENYGVTPDLPYVETERDLREGHVDYKAAINAEVQKLISAV